MGGSRGGGTPSYVKTFVSQISADIKKNYRPSLSSSKKLIFLRPFRGVFAACGTTKQSQNICLSNIY